MPIRDMLHDAEWRAAGAGTLAERRDLLIRLRARAHVAELQAALSVLDTKIAGYGDPASMESDDDADGSREWPPPWRPRRTTS